MSVLVASAYDCVDCPRRVRPLREVHEVAPAPRLDSLSRVRQEKSGEDVCNPLSRYASVVRCEARLRASKRSVSEGPSAGLPTVRRSPTFGRASVSTARAVTWLILPVVICLSQRLSHACLSMNASHCETANGSLNQL